MLLSDFITQLSRVTFILLAAATAWDLIRHRDRTRLDIFLLFGSLALSTLVTEVASLIGAALPDWWARVSALLIMLQPFLLIRLVNHFRPVPRRIQIASVIGLVIVAVLLVLVPAPYPGWMSLALVAYFVWAEVYAVLAFVRGARASGGPTRWRQALAAAGSAELGGLIALAGIGILLPSLAAVIAPLNQLFGLLSGIAYYLAFAPPRWLRTTWQTNELYGFLREFAGKDAQARVSEILPSLCSAATRVVGGRGSLVALWDEAQQTLIAGASDLPVWVGVSVLPETGPIRWAWDERKPTIANRSIFSPEGRRLADFVGADALVVVPVQTAERAWGVLITMMQRPPVFPQDDVALLQLYTEQTALALEQAHLLDEQRALVDHLRLRGEQLEAANRELEAFSYSVSHDLRAPLRHIEGFTNLLQRGSATESQQHQLKRIAEAATRMGGLIDDLLAFSRMSRAEMTSLGVHLDSLVQEARRDLQVEAENR
ncbi:MAG: histidine kinase dimerization/phospho-acceptor domain-containing protein, partial [Anaerolineales bacterium]